MPSISSKQHNFMAMSRSERGRARLRAMGRKPAPKGVAEEFAAADEGKHFPKSMAKHKKMARGAQARRRTHDDY